MTTLGQFKLHNCEIKTMLVVRGCLAPLGQFESFSCDSCDILHVAHMISYNVISCMWHFWDIVSLRCVSCDILRCGSYDILRCDILHVAFLRGDASLRQTSFPGGCSLIFDQILIFLQIQDLPLCLVANLVPAFVQRNIKIHRLPNFQKHKLIFQGY